MSLKQILITAAFFGLTGVILGAMGAHALDADLTNSQLTNFNTGVRYQFWHALALLILYVAGDKVPAYRQIALFWTLGILLFSGSIYLLSLQDLIGSSMSWMGPITPIGGGLMVLGWLILLISALRRK